jgi:hypothetical protein
MLLFLSEEHVDRWCRFRGLPRGGTMSPEQCWQLAQAWYGNKLSADWRRATAEEAAELLGRIGPSGSFWRLRT